MSRYFETNAIFDALWDHSNLASCEICKILDDIPTADVAEVKLGEWVYGEFDIPHCSECGEEVMPNNISKYCPNCGAKMIEEDEQ